MVTATNFSWSMIYKPLYTVFREWQYEHAMKENEKDEDKPFNLFWVISRWSVMWYNNILISIVDHKI